MYALILTLFFTGTTDAGVNRFNQTVLTKTGNKHFTKEECEYVQEILVEDMRKFYAEKKKGGNVVQLSLTCAEVTPMIQQQSVGVVPIPDKSGINKKSFNFNGAKTL